MHDYSVSEIQNVVVFQRFQADFFVDILHAKENVGHAMFVMTHSHQNNAEKRRVRKEKVEKRLEKNKRPARPANLELSSGCDQPSQPLMSADRVDHSESCRKFPVSM